MDRNLFRRLVAIIACSAFPALLCASGETGQTGAGALPAAKDAVQAPHTETGLSETTENTDAASNTDKNEAGPVDAKQVLRGPEVFFETWQDRPEVKRYIDYFTGPVGRNWILDGMERSALFKDFIIATIASKSLPRELYFLVLVESTFNVDAVSRSGAAGLWQFMLNSLGTMKTSEWVDERFDFWSSTNAALDKLSYNYSVLKDWLLAFAAYNAGLGRIQRLIHKYPGENFWQLSLHSDFPKETRDYVPRILAAAYVGSHPGRYDFPTVWTEALYWQKIAVTKAVHIRELEQKSGVPDNLLMRGNAELRFETTPFGAPLYYIKVPVKYRENVLMALGSTAMLTGMRLHTVAAGDTVFNIAKRYGVSEKMIVASNPGLKSQKLGIGQTLVIPLPASGESSENSK